VNSVRDKSLGSFLASFGSALYLSFPTIKQLMLTQKLFFRKILLFVILSSIKVQIRILFAIRDAAYTMSALNWLMI